MLETLLLADQLDAIAGQLHIVAIPHSCRRPAQVRAHAEETPAVYMRGEEGQCAAGRASDSMRPCQVFINHTGLDCGTLAGWLKFLLQLCRVNAFLDESGGPQAGEHWPDVLKHAARTCKVFIALISPRYFERDWPARELCLALGRWRAQRQGQPGTTDLVVIPGYVGWTRQKAAEAAVSAARRAQGGWRSMLVWRRLGVCRSLPAPQQTRHMMAELAQLQPPNAQRIYWDEYKLTEVQLVLELVRAVLNVLRRRHSGVSPGKLA